MKHRATIFGLSGCTNAGKTTIANQLVQRLEESGFSVAHVCQDDFFKKPDKVRQVASTLAPAELFYHYDEPSAVDENGMAEAISNLSNLHDVVIVEGNMLCELSSVDCLLNRIVFFTMTKEECAKRRNNRSYDPADKPGYFEEIVWPAYEQHYSNALKRYNEGDVISFQSGTHDLKEIVDKVAKLLEVTFNNLIKIQSDPLHTSKAESFVNLPSCGAISTFIGTTRNNFNGKKVLSLEYECYQAMAYSELRKVCDSTREKYPDVERIAIFHRIGKVDIGEASVIIATSSPHRKEAIEATHYAIDLLKKTVPIFKKEIYTDGTKSWKENCEFSDLKGELKENESDCGCQR